MAWDKHATQHVCNRHAACKESSVLQHMGLVDFAIRQVNILWSFLGGNSNERCTVINAHQKIFFRLVEMTFGLEHISYILPEIWQPVKLTSFQFALCVMYWRTYMKLCLPHAFFLQWATLLLLLISKPNSVRHKHITI